MLGLIAAINALTAVLDDILDQIEIIAQNTTPADPTTPDDPQTPGDTEPNP